MSESMPDAAAVAELMATCARDARKVASSKFNRVLDGSFESVQVLEEVVALQHIAIPRGLRRLFQKPPTDEQLQQSALLWGGYLGEVLRERLGGTWSYVEEGPMAGAICLDIDGALISPPAKVRKRLENGPEDDLWYYAYVIDHDHNKAAKTSDES